MSNALCQEHRWPDARSAGVIAALQSRRAEITKIIHAHIQGSIPSSADNSLDYQEGVREAVASLVDYCLNNLSRGPQRSLPIPPEAALQARRAARYGVSLGVVLRRYVTGHRRLGELIAEEAGACGVDGAVLQLLYRTLEELLERVIADVESEYDQELEQVGRSPQRHRAEMVRRLLAGAAVDPSELVQLDYEVSAPWHLGLIVTGVKAKDVLRVLGARLSQRLLQVSYEDKTEWAWLGGLRKLTVGDVERLLPANGSDGLSIAFGEPGEGIDGWRQTHQEAQLAMLIASRKPATLTRCVDVLPEATLVQNETMATLLIKTYLAPLNGLRKNGQTARETLRAYLAHGRNIACTAASLQVVRRTVENRLHEIEEVFGCPLHTRLTGLEIALRLEELGYTSYLDDDLRR